MLLNVGVPDAFLPGGPLANKLYDEVVKGRRASRGVKDERFLVGETFRAVEAGLQEMVNRAHDIADDRLRRVSDAAHVAHLRVVGGKECLVEVDNRVLPGLAFAEVLQDFGHVGVFEEFHNVVHGPGDCVGHGNAGQFGEEPPEKRVCLGQIERSHFAGETFVLRRVDAGGEQTVSEGLCKHVGEVAFGEVGDERFTEGGEPAVKPAGARAVAGHGFLDNAALHLHGLLFFLFQRSFYEIPDDPCHSRHPAGQLLGGSDCERGLAEKGIEQLRQLVCAVGRGLEFAFGVQVGNAERQALFAGDEPVELQVVRENPVGQRGVTLELVAVRSFAQFHLVEVGSDVFCLDMAERDGFSGDLKVRTTAENSFRLVGRRYVLARRFEQLFERGAVRVFGWAEGQVLPDFRKIVCNQRHFILPHHG